MKANQFFKTKIRKERGLCKISLILIVFCLTIIGNVFGAENEMKKGTISGRILDKETNTPIHYAQVAIYSQEDSLLVNGTITDENGMYTIEKIPLGLYYLEAEFLGYEKYNRNDIILDANNNLVAVDDIFLNEVNAELDEVNVIGQKNNMVIKADRKVLNVDKNLSATGGTAVDALKISPSITISQDGNVLLRGSSNFKVLIDGKPTALKPNEVLKQMPSGRIDNIEIITNPSAKYDSEGTAGIINIITKKGIGVGTSGVLNATAGTGDKYNADFNLNYSNDKLNVTVGLKWKDYQQFYDMDEILETVKDGNKRRNDVIFYRHQLDKDLSANLALDYSFNKNNNLSYSVDFGSTDFVISANFKYDETTENTIGHNYVFEDLDAGILADYYTNNLSFTHNFSENSSWTNTLFYSKINYFFDNYQERTNTIEDFVTSGLSPYYRMRFENDNFSTEVRGKTDYTKSYDSGSKLEVGGQYHKYHRYLDLNAENYDFNLSNWQPDDVFSNEFDFNEQIISGYTNFSGEKNGINYNLGLRLEFTNRLIESFTITKKYTYEKLNYFPTLSLSKGFGEKERLTFNFARRIDRPDEYYLNPFPDISNEFQEAYGNPMLRPNLTNSYELGFQHQFSKGSFSSQAFLRTTNDAYTQVIGSDNEGVMILTFDNISDDREFGVENMVNWQAFKWWSLNASFNVLGQSSKGYMNEEYFDRSTVTFDTRLINSISIGKHTSAQLMAFYFHDRLGNSIGNVEKFYWFDASVQHNFLKDRLSFTIQAKDVFNTNQVKFDINRSDYRFYVHRKPEYPTILLNVSYKFNNYKSKDNSVKTKLKIG